VSTRDQAERLKSDEDESKLKRADTHRAMREHHRRAFVASIARRLNIRWSLRRC
jgi:hypothetical protein